MTSEEYEEKRQRLEADAAGVTAVPGPGPSLPPPRRILRRVARRP